MLKPICGELQSVTVDKIDKSVTSVMCVDELKENGKANGENGDKREYQYTLTISVQGALLSINVGSMRPPAQCSCSKPNKSPPALGKIRVTRFVVSLTSKFSKRC